MYLYELSLLGLEDPASDWKKEDGEKSVLAESICELLFTKKEMLLDYFSIEINDQKQLCSIPYLLGNKIIRYLLVVNQYFHLLF